jgi:hypothetical protein
MWAIRDGDLWYGSDKRWHADKAKAHLWLTWEEADAWAAYIRGPYEVVQV